MLRFLLRKRLHRTTLFCVLLLGILAGVALSSVLRVPVQGWYVVIWLPAVFYGLRKLVVGAALLLLVVGVGLGFSQGILFKESLEPYQSLQDKKVVLLGVIEEDPTYSSKGNRQIFISDIELEQGSAAQKLPGSLFVSSPFSADIRRHDKVRIEGTLRQGFGQFQGAISFAKITKLSEQQHPIDTFRSAFAASVTSVLPEPHAGLGLGFVIGLKSALPADMEDALRDLSLTHIIVASGYNLTILIRAAKRLREKHSKLQTLLLSFGLIGLFLGITGASPSMVRAGLVSGLTVLAWYYGRQFKPLVLLLFVMALTAFFYPPYLWGDLGWWLSFAAFAGIMIVVPLLIERFWKGRQPSFVGQIALEALVAQLMTLPIILLVFGNLSVLGIVANVLIVPFIPFAMIATTLAGFAQMVLPTIAPYAALPAHAILAVIVSAVKLLSAVPWATVSLQISLTALIAWYVAITGIISMMWLRLSRQQKRIVLEQQIV